MVDRVPPRNRGARSLLKQDGLVVRQNSTTVCRGDQYDFHFVIIDYVIWIAALSPHNSADECQHLLSKSRRSTTLLAKIATSSRMNVEPVTVGGEAIFVMYMYSSAAPSPGPNFKARCHTSTANIAAGPVRVALEISGEERSKNCSFGIGAKSVAKNLALQQLIHGGGGIVVGIATNEHSAHSPCPRTQQWILARKTCKTCLPLPQTKAS